MTIEKVKEKWWKNWNGENLPKKVVKNKAIVDALLNASDALGRDTKTLKDFLKVMLPKKGSDVSQVSFFESATKYQLERRTVSSPGRFFRRIFETAPDPLVEAFSAWWETNIVFDATDYILHVGSTQEDFKNAFTNYCKTKVGLDYNLYKSISDSCMRYPFDEYDHHPSVVYASGDFTVVTVKNKKGKTRARVIVGHKENTGIYGYIYTSCNHSAQMLKDWLNIKGYVTHNNYFIWKNWGGLKLLKISCNANYKLTFLCPYIDTFREVAVYDENYLILKHTDRSEINNTSGVVTFFQDTVENKKYWESTQEGVKE